MASLASVVINMSVNSARLATGLRQSERMTQSFVRRTQGGFSRLRGSIGGLQTALIGVTAVLGTRELLNNADALIKASDAAGISFDTYQDLAQGLALAGVNQQGFMRGLRTLANSFQQAEAGSAQFVEAFSQIGLSYEQLIALSPEDRFLAVLSGLNGVTDATERTALANDLLGRSFADVNVNAANLLREGMGIANINLEAARASENLNDRFEELSSTIRNLLTNAVVPLLENIVPLIQQFVTFLSENPRLVAFAAAAAGITAVIIPLGIALGGIVSAISGFVAVILPVGAILGGVASAVVALGAAVGAPILVPIAAVVAAVAGVIAVFRNWSSIIEFVSNLFSGFADLVGNFLSRIVGFAESAGSGFFNTLTGWFSRTEEEAVGGSIIPDMVAGIERYMERLPSIGEQAGTGFARGFLGALREAQDATMEFMMIGENAFNGLSDVITDFVTTGMANFRDFARSIIRDIISIQVRRGLSSAFTSLLGGGAANPIASIFGGFRQNGGPVTQGRAYVVGEAGPEVFVPRGDGEIVANGRSGGGSSNNTYNINAVDAASFEQLVARNPSFISNVVQRGNRQLGLA